MFSHFVFIVLYFFVDAPITDVKEASFNPALGHAVTLRCDTLANPSSTAWSWKYNGFDLDFTGKTYLVDMDSTADVGRYTCIAYNEVGQSSEIEFTVGLGEGPTPSMYDLLKYFYSLGTNLCAFYKIH